jgi:hypothetical protein
MTNLINLQATQNEFKNALNLASKNEFLKNLVENYPFSLPSEFLKQFFLDCAKNYIKDLSSLTAFYNTSKVSYKNYCDVPEASSIAEEIKALRKNIDNLKALKNALMLPAIEVLESTITEKTESLKFDENKDAKRLHLKSMKTFVTNYTDIFAVVLPELKNLRSAALLEIITDKYSNTPEVIDNSEILFNYLNAEVTA